MKRPATTQPAGLPHRYRLAGIGYAKSVAVKRGIRHRTIGGYLFTEKPL